MALARARINERLDQLLIRTGYGDDLEDAFLRTTLANPIAVGKTELDYGDVINVPETPLDFIPQTDIYQELEAATLAAYGVDQWQHI